MRISVTVPGASPEEIRARETAARDVFERAGIDPRLAAWGAHERERWDTMGFRIPGPPGVLMDAAAVWDNAMSAALDANGPHWIDASATGQFELVDVDWSAPIPGMPADPTRAIVAKALELRKQHPGMRAIAILDQALADHHGSHPMFAGEPASELRPESAFGAIVHEAFLPGVPVPDGDVGETADDFERMWPAVYEAEKSFAEQWEAAVRAFGARYGLWQMGPPRER
jgi:hypothetical protein